MKISVLLPTLNPELARMAMDRLRQQFIAERERVDWEFVVVSPFEVTGDDVRWLPEQRPDGPTAAMRHAAEGATGEILLIASDDIEFAPGTIAETVAVFADPDRKAPLVLAFPHRDRGVEYAFVAFGSLTPTFFAIPRSEAARCGGLLDPAYAVGYADVDLGLRAWANGGRVENARSWVKYAVSRERAEDKPEGSAKLRADFALFMDRWAAKFDPVWGTEENGLSFSIATCAIPLLSDDARTIRIDGRAAARDLRIVRAISSAGWLHSSPPTRETMEAGLRYLRWVAKLAENPAQTQVAHWYWAGLVKPGRQSLN